MAHRSLRNLPWTGAVVALAVSSGAGAQPAPRPLPVPTPVPGPTLPAPPICQNWSFTNGTACWTLSDGGPFLPLLRHPGTGNREDLSSIGNPGVGTAVSTAIVVEHPYLTFTLRGAASPAVRVELLARDDAGPVALADGNYRIAATTSNLHPETGPGRSGRHVFDLSLLHGAQVRIRVVDEAPAADVGALVDDFLFTSTAPAVAWSFDPGLDGWQMLEGDAFLEQPLAGDAIPVMRVRPPGFIAADVAALGGDYWDTAFPVGNIGAGWIGTYDRRDTSTVALPTPRGDGTTGILASLPFTVATAQVSLLIGGGNDPTVRGAGPMAGAAQPAQPPTAITLGAVLQVLRDGVWRDARWATGQNREMLDRVVWDVAPLRGATARILIVDRRTDAWGHVNVDDIRFADRFDVVRYDVGVGTYARDRGLDAPPALWGYADSHLHVMSYLGFGGRMIGGTPTGALETALACDGEAHGGTVRSVTVDGRTVDLPVSHKLLEVMDGMPMDEQVMGLALARIGLDFLGIKSVADVPKLYAWVVAAFGVLSSQPAWWIASAHTPVPALVTAHLADPVATMAELTALVAVLDGARSKWMAGVGHQKAGWKSVQPTDEQRAASGQARDNPAIEPWPNNFSRLHQQAHVTWLRRAHQGGLRMIVMMAVHAEIFAEAQGNWQSAEDALVKQVEAAKAMAAANPTWMQIVTSADEARRAIGSGKLAIVLGVEIGSIDKMFDPGLPDPYTALADRLWNLGVRHVYPVHNTDNSFGGTAINSNLYTINNYYLNQRFYRVEDGRRHGILPTRKWLPSGLGSGLTVEIGGGKLPMFPVFMAILGAVQAEGKLRTAKLNTWTLDLVDLRHKLEAAVPVYEATEAQVNAQGLTADRGMKMIDALMRRGFVIDFDHSSFKTRADIVALARQTPGGYPVTSSHTDLLAMHLDPNEGMIKDSELEDIYGLGGTVGPVWSLSDDVRDAAALACTNSSTSFLAAWRKAVVAMHGRGMPMGTDMVGFLPAPHPRFGHDRCLPTATARADLAPRGGVRYAHYPAGPTVASPDGAAQPDPTQPGSTTKQIYLGDNPPLTALTQGSRTYDVNVDGPAHVGLVPDFFQDVANQAPDHRRLFTPLFTGATGYVDMLGRAERGAVARASVPRP